MKILVAGGAGFIGSHLCRKLWQQGFEVICLDNFFTGRRENVADLLDQPRFTLIEHDVTEAFSEKVDRIYNLACPASPVHYQLDPVRTIKTSVWGAFHTLELAQSCNSRVLLASTSEVYGDPKVHPQPESYWGHVNPIGPRSCYDEGKRVAETLMMGYQQTRQVDVRIARIFNTYGPSMRPDDGRVVSNFIMQALQNKPISIYGDGSQTRSFCYVSDLVEGLYQLMEQTVGPEPVNLGNPGEFTIKQLAEEVCRLVGVRPELFYKPLPTDDPTRRKPDIHKAKNLLGWTPGISLEDGLRLTIEYFRTQLS